jgi:hypothetical protein
MLVTFESMELVANETKKQTIARARGAAARILEEANALVETTIQTVTSEMNACAREPTGPAQAREPPLAIPTIPRSCSPVLPCSRAAESPSRALAR